MSESAIVVLPEPDSPISATTSPRPTVKLTSLTIGTSPRPSGPGATTRRSSISTSGAAAAVSVAMAVILSLPPWAVISAYLPAAAAAQAGYAVHQQVDPDSQRGDGERRHEHGRSEIGRASCRERV